MIKCRPESVSVMSDISPTFSANDTSSNAFCILLRVKAPKSPPRFADEQSLNSPASSLNLWRRWRSSSIDCSCS